MNRFGFAGQYQLREDPRGGGFVHLHDEAARDVALRRIEGQQPHREPAAKTHKLAQPNVGVEKDLRLRRGAIGAHGVKQQRGNQDKSAW